MQLLQLTKKIPFPPHDGDAIATLALSENFAKLGHQVHLLSMNTNKHYVNPQVAQQGLAKDITLHSVNVNTNLSIGSAITNLLFSRRAYIQQRFVNKKFAAKLKQLLTQNNYDIIQAEGLYLLHYTPLIRKYSNAKIAFRAHNVEHEIWKHIAQNTTNKLKKWYFNNMATRLRQFELQAAGFCDLIVPISQEDALFFSSLSNSIPIHYAPFGIDRMPDAIPNFDTNNLQYYHLGALDWIPNQQGINWFINMVWNDTAAAYNKQFHLAGRNAPESFANKLPKNVKFHGQVDSATDFIRDKHVCIVPLFSGSGMRIKIIEAMAHGKIIITTSRGISGIPATSGKHLLIANTATEFKNTIKNIENGQINRHKIAKNAQEFIRKNYDNTKIAQEALLFYQNYS